MHRQLPVFVYGTLLRGFSNHAICVKPFPHTERKATIRGEIYHLPEGYPGLLIGAEEKNEAEVTGAVLDFAPEVYDKALAVLDELETYYGEGDPRNEYERMIVAARLADTGQEVLVYVYRYLDQEYARQAGTKVAHGDWRRFMEGSG
ncbi:gamma-glutamylcyclotransferase family protein [Brevibacillus sp. SAFN-007a]|uniref:gamma-glutamylcyclotransferase family protein n=1 Tax=Brevibacillus sp. SAFN-007a TaxID=3436862 RepID=UPI003F8205E2